MAKVFCSDNCMKHTTNAIQILGGRGYLKGYDVERYFRDAKVTRISTAPARSRRSSSPATYWPRASRRPDRIFGHPRPKLPKEGLQIVNGLNDARPSPGGGLLPDRFALDRRGARDSRSRPRLRRGSAAPGGAAGLGGRRVSRSSCRSSPALDVVGGTVQGYGCPGMTSVAFGLVLQELSRVDSSFATFFNVQAGLSMTTIATCGSEEQKARWMPLAGDVRGDRRIRPDRAGARERRLTLETRAVRDGDDYVLDGAKRWIGNATICDVAIVWARAEDGIAGFLVEPPRSGFTATVIDGKLAQRGVWQADIRLGELPGSGGEPTAAGRLPGGGADPDYLPALRRLARHR